MVGQMVKGGSTAYVAGLLDDKCDPALGCMVQQHLHKLGFETPRDLSATYDPQMAAAHLQEGVYNAFRNLGLDVEDPSLRETPKRFACMVIGELTKGLNYDFFPKCTTVPNGKQTPEDKPLPGGGEVLRYPVSKGAYNQMVLVRKVQTISLCEHHLQTIDGFTHVAYIPTTKVLGLSKVARVVDFFARRPQIQERMTEQIFHALNLILETDDIAVVQTATHFCMKARGVLQHASDTTTDKMGGRFMTNPALREELNARIQAP